MKRTRAARPAHRTRAWLLRRVEHGESDLVLALFTESLGRVSALARSARKSRKRFGGVLEPFHTLSVDLEESAGELMTLREASLAEPRLVLTRHLDRMDAAGIALGWVRSAAPPRVPEPPVWRSLSALMDALDVDAPVHARLRLAEAGLSLLDAFGWGLDLEHCVRCGRDCEPGKTALLDPERGGLVCRACGGARLRLPGPARGRLLAGALLPEDVDLTLGVVEAALRAHAGVG